VSLDTPNFDFLGSPGLCRLDRRSPFSFRLMFVPPLLNETLLRICSFIGDDLLRWVCRSLSQGKTFRIVTIPCAPVPSQYPFAVAQKGTRLLFLISQENFPLLKGLTSFRINDLRYLITLFALNIDPLCHSDLWFAIFFLPCPSTVHSHQKAADGFSSICDAVFLIQPFLS